ncbi:LysR family transcriptional regulator [Ruegeria sediminis]|uniref:LysR family transcriptional regulator n=1 Tax=Ruegeria sediminis TaxID=2583820 RepID=A0ABY2WZP9_9RHOB|nr:LysR family transcriptional regulator [Ruegeria sediminis]TMV08471.1 LysR family transcriptional regulator [Ruegeria sediminis]
MKRTNLSLRWLEVFQLVAKSGSVRKVASDTGLSVSTVSHHLRSLEENLGVSLLDHSRRPMVVTPAGAIFLRYVTEGLHLIRRGETELTSGNLEEVRELRLGIVDDFDSEVAPELAQFLAQAMPKCTFKHHTRPSHEIIQLLLEHKLDVGVATRPVNDVPELQEYPLLRDPLVLAVPASSTVTPEDFLAGGSGLPFLRYSRNQIIGNLIEAHLRRIKAVLPNRFELESNQSIFGMIAEGSGWAVTTPGSYVRAKRFHDRVALRQFPGKGFVRTLSLFTTEVYPQSMAEIIAGTMRRLITRHFVEPVTREFAWLSTDFRPLSKAEQKD